MVNTECTCVYRHVPYGYQNILWLHIRYLKVAYTNTTGDNRYYIFIKLSLIRPKCFFSFSLFTQTYLYHDHNSFKMAHNFGYL